MEKYNSDINKRVITFLFSYRINGKIHTMVTLMEGYVELFTAYEVIRQYADYKSIKIINKTKGSFIDAFEKG